MSQNGNFDDLFGEIAARSGNIDSLLDSFFGFLNRRTDFYCVVENPEEKFSMGFPPGIAKTKLLKAFSKYEQRIVANSDNLNQADVHSPVKTIQSPKNSPYSTPSKSSLSPSKPSLTPPKSTPAKLISDKGLQIPIGNGGWTERYYWTQSLTEVVIYIDVPFGTRAKNISCIIAPSKLRVSVDNVSIINGEIDSTVVVDESLWNLNNDAQSALSQIIITLLKMKPTWWKSIIQGDPEIDTNKVDSTQRIDEYDIETQAGIRKLVFEQREQMKLNGKLGMTQLQGDAKIDFAVSKSGNIDDALQADINRSLRFDNLSLE